MFLLFDIGGTKMRLAISRNGKVFERPKIVPTPQKFKLGIELFVNTAKELVGGKKIRGVAGGIAGPLDGQKEKLVGAPNLPEWNNKPLVQELKQALKAPIKIDNDAAVVGLGEAVAGAGKGKNIVAYLTISTGVGGARIVDGKIDSNALGFEPGHQIINFCGGRPRDLESYIGGNAIKRHYHQSAKKITNKKTWRQINGQIAYGLHNIIVFWSPEIIVLGGGMIKNPHLDLDYARQQLKKTIKRFPEIPLIKTAKLKDAGGLYGGLQLIKSGF